MFVLPVPSVSCVCVACAKCPLDALNTVRKIELRIATAGKVFDYIWSSPILIFLRESPRFEFGWIFYIKYLE